MDPILHGRDAALAPLRGALDDALLGRGLLALVSGEAGIGKSAIAAVVAREAEARGASVTWGRAWELADAPPYFPLWSCLRSLGLELEHQDHAGSGAFQLWERVLTALARTSRAAAVWILEDVHAADLGTLDLLTFLAHQLRSLPVLIVATARAKDPRLTDRVMQRLTRISRDGLEVRLEPLGLRDVADITTETVGRAVPEAAVRRLLEITGGNPLFVVECARAFRSTGGGEGALLSLPPTVRQVVLERASSLPESTRVALAHGAVLGREFTAAIVARMLESLPARVIDVLLPALRAGIVDETAPGRFIFSHVLVCDAIASALGREEQADIHRRAEIALAALGDAPDVLVERARHALAALPNGDGAQAVAIARRATELMERDGAFDRAFELHARLRDARAAALLPPAAPAETLHVASVARAAGRSDVSRRLCEEVASSARAIGDSSLLARAALLRSADVRPGVVDRAQVALLEEARAALGAADTALGCRVLARLATALQPAPDPAIPMAMGREAIDKARATNDDATVLDVLDVAVWCLYAAPLAERRACGEEILGRALRAGDLPRALIGHEWNAFHDVEAGDFDAFHRDADAMLALSDEIGHPRYRWRALLIASARAVALGHFAESERYLTEVRELRALTDDPSMPLALTMHQILRLRMQRRDDELAVATMRLDEVMDGIAQGTAIALLNRASCAARAEDEATTRTLLASLGAGAASFETGHTMPATLLSEVYALVGSDDDRRRIRGHLVRGGAAEVCGGQMSFTYEGTVVRMLGLLDAALGDVTAAERELREAHGLAVARKHAPWVAQTAYELGKLLRRAGREHEARSSMEESARIARDLGMTGLERSASAHAAPVPIPSATAASIEIARSAAGFTLSRGDTVILVKDSRGMQILARLIERRDEEIHVLALAADDESASLPETNAGEVLDERARRAYRTRLADLDDALAAARQRADSVEAAKLEREKRALVAELSRATGIGGRARRAGSATERARVNVQRRIKDAIARISQADEDLGRWLEGAVRTGTFCCFRPK